MGKIKNFIKCPHCDYLIIDVKPTDISKIHFRGGKRSGTMLKLSCPHCGNKNINLDCYDPRCGGVEMKYRFNI